MEEGEAGSAGDVLQAVAAVAGGSLSNMTASMPMIRLDNVSKVYRMGSLEVTALRGASLSVQQGEMVAIMGPSGSGKSTLMNVLGCLDVPTSGAYFLEGAEGGRMGAGRRAGMPNR